MIKHLQAGHAGVHVLYDSAADLAQGFEMEETEGVVRRDCCEEAGVYLDDFVDV